jgi:hypothetical protein
VVKLGWEKQGEEVVSNLIRNERIKYWATFFNNIAVISFATGGIVPIFQEHAGFWVFAGSLLIGFFVALSFIALSQLELGRLKE